MHEITDEDDITKFTKPRLEAFLDYLNGNSQDLMDRFRKAQQTSEDRLSQFKQANSQAFSQSDEQVVSA